MFSALRPFLNKGGAGYSISRAETAERLRPLVERHLDLLQAYAAALPRLRTLPGGEAVAALMPYLRTDLSKLYETVYSLGGDAPTGAERDFEAGAPGGDADVVRRLLDLEKETGDAARDEIDAVHHQERTRAILKTLAKGAEARTERLRAVAGQVRRGAVHAE
jgi:hypothetical protein